MYRIEEEEQHKRNWGQGRSDYYAAQIALEVRSLSRQVSLGFIAMGVFKDTSKSWGDLKLQQCLFDFLQEEKKSQVEKEKTEQEMLDAMSEEEFQVYKAEWNRKKAERSMQIWGAGLGLTPKQIKESM